MVQQQQYRNGMFYVVSFTATKVVFEPHGNRLGPYKVCYECSVENWEAGRIFDR